jgi:hypothetical protein
VPIDLAITLKDRLADRVVVSVRVAPVATDPRVDGVAVELRSRTGEVLGARLHLPVAGRLIGPIETQVELRASQPIPRGSQVIAEAWWPGDQVEAACPADPCTHLETFMKGARAVCPTRADFSPNTLDGRERSALASSFPWIKAFRACCQEAEPSRILDEEPRIDDVVADFAEQVGLDEECSDWLRDLLNEEDA